MSQPTAPKVITYTQRDDYGRNVLHTQIAGAVVCVRVTLPKNYRETHGMAYLINDWSGPKDDNGHNTVTEVATLKEAREVEAVIVAREVAARSK